VGKQRRGIDCARRSVMNRLTHDEARHIAVNIAKLPVFIEAEKYRQAKGE
jgi:hypothetical protein